MRTIYISKRDNLFLWWPSSSVRFHCHRGALPDLFLSSLSFSLSLALFIFPLLAPHSLLSILVSLPNTPIALTIIIITTAYLTLSLSLLLSLSLSVVWDNSKLYYLAALNGNWPCSWARFSPVSRWHTVCGPGGMKHCLPFDLLRPFGTVAPSCPVYLHCWKRKKMKPKFWNHRPRTKNKKVNKECQYSFLPNING